MCVSIFVNVNRKVEEMGKRKKNAPENVRERSLFQCEDGIKKLRSEPRTLDGTAEHAAANDEISEFE